MRFSRTLALLYGLLLPLAETVRRWNTWQEFPPSLFDDYVIGAFLLSGAWLVGRDFRRGQLLLTAAWGFGCGLGYGSFFGQLRNLQEGIPDPAPIASEWVAVIKGVGLALGIAALICTLMAKPPSAPDKLRADAT